MCLTCKDLLVSMIKARASAKRSIDFWNKEIKILDKSIKRLQEKIDDRNP